MADKKLQLKDAVRLATELNGINLSEAPLIIDSIVVAIGDRILVKDGASKDGIEAVNDKRNGIYEVKDITTTHSVLERAKDANRNKEVTAGLFTFVSEGSANKDTGWLLITNDPIDLDVTNLNFIKFSDSGEVSADIQKIIDRNADNIALLSFRQQTLHSLNLSAMVDGKVDEYEDETLVDNIASINDIYDSVNDLYTTLNNTLKLLLNLNGANGQTSTTDASPSGHTINFNGTAQLDTTKKQFGSASLKLDGNSDFLDIPNSPDFDVFGSTTEDYTLDCWVNSPLNANNAVLMQSNAGSGTGFWDLFVLSDGGLFSRYRDNSNVLVFQVQTGAGVITANTWTHIAMIKTTSGGTMNFGFYVNGIQVLFASTTTTATMSEELLVGAFGSLSSSLSSFFEGNIDDIRIDKLNSFGASPNVGLTDTITVPTSEATGSIINTTLISESFLAGAQASNGRLIIFKEDKETIVLNTDIKGFISRDNGVTFTQVTLADRGVFEDGKSVAGASVDISSQPGGTDMVYKIETANNKDLRIHGTGLFWD